MMNKKNQTPPLISGFAAPQILPGIQDLCEQIHLSAGQSIVTEIWLPAMKKNNNEPQIKTRLFFI